MCPSEARVGEYAIVESRHAGTEELPGMSYGEGIQVNGPVRDRYEEILAPQALDLVALLQRELGPRRTELLAARAARQQELSAGATLDFLAETAQIRLDRSWRVASPAAGLVDRR